STGPGSIGQSGDAWWAYCVVSADHSQIASELEGIEPGTRVEAVVEGGLAALVSPVPLTEYGDERLRQHLEDIEWLERTARCHEAVLEQVMERASIVPLRLCTLYHDRDGIRRMLLQHAEGLAGSLAAVEGTAEWGVKVFLEAEPGGPAASVQAAEQPERPATGTGYLAQRQQERQAARLRDEISQECVEEVHGVMCDLARDARLNAVQRPEAHGREGEMLLNGAYLVDREQESGLSSAVAQLQSRWSARGFAVELTGPWPPYNFVSESAGMIS
ncbi:MAG TPA: GvpL/GvpF family gas vesicle protein, partial [Solirubrobacteraceae bacterium]|nr:GvpL/GvpF family gas vesicle protein [Solirubrobacteraceae bacterium]